MNRQAPKSYCHRINIKRHDSGVPSDSHYVPEGSGGTLFLHGGSHELQLLEPIVELLVFVTQHLKLENLMFLNIGMVESRQALDFVNRVRSAWTWLFSSKKVVEPLTLSSSPTIIIDPPVMEKRGVGPAYVGAFWNNFVSHQSISFIMSCHIPPPHFEIDAPISSWGNSHKCHKKVIDIEFYRKEGIFKDATLRDYLDNLLATSLCPSSACRKPLSRHVLTYAHRNVRIAVAVTEIQLEASNLDDMYQMWTSCQICHAKTEAVELTVGASFLSFGKYLELLIYSQPPLCNPSMCDHIALGQNFKLRRWFRRGAKFVLFDMEEILLIEASLPRFSPLQETAGDAVSERPLAMQYMLHTSSILDVRHDITVFYASVQAHISALDLALPDGPLLEVTKARQALRDLEVFWRSDESELLKRLSAPCPEEVNDIRRALVLKVGDVSSRLNGWANIHGAPVGLDKTLALFSLPEYSDGSGLSPKAYPGSFVIVRDDEPTSIIAFTLASAPFLDELLKLFREQQYQSLPTSTGSPTLSPASAVGAASPPWEGEEEFRIQVSPRSHGSRHLKLRFGEGRHLFECTVYYAAEFEKFRRRYGISECFIQSLLRCVPWNSSGGKSKASFFKTLDDEFVVKQLKTDWTVAEKDALLAFAPAYLDYVSSEEASFLVKMFGFFSIMRKNLATGVSSHIDLLVMENLFAKRPKCKIFDLKGVPDRRAPRRPLANGSVPKEAEVGWDGDWVDGNFPDRLMLQAGCKIIIDSVKKDTNFLASSNVMDYSLLVGLGLDEERREMILGIVDFIGPYNWWKSIESRGKAIAARSKDTVTVVAPEEYAERLRRRLDSYFFIIPDKWSARRCNEESRNIRLPMVL